MSEEKGDFDVLTRALGHEKALAAETIRQRLNGTHIQQDLGKAPRQEADRAVARIQDACDYYDRVVSEMERVERARVAAFNAEPA